MNDVKRPVWPIYAWLCCFSSVASTVLFITGIWGDGRFGLTACVMLVPAFIFGVASWLTADAGTTYTKRSRGWRKIRRETEQRARIKQLERELGLN